MPPEIPIKAGRMAGPVRQLVRLGGRTRRGEIEGSGISLLPLPMHDGFEPEIRARHGRNPTFRAYVKGTRRDRHDDADDLTL
jgi:hypothetical protein